LQNHGKKLFRISAQGTSTPFPLYIDFHPGRHTHGHPGGCDRFLFQPQTLISVSLGVRMKYKPAKVHILRGFCYLRCHPHHKAQFILPIFPMILQQPRVGKSKPMSMAEQVRLA
jgi:hypothetical protein